MEKVHSGGSPKCMTTTRRLWHDSQECKLIFYKSAALRKRGKRTLAEASEVEAMSDMTTDWCTRASQHHTCSNTSVYVQYIVQDLPENKHCTEITEALHSKTMTNRRNSFDLRSTSTQPIRGRRNNRTASSQLAQSQLYTVDTIPAT